MPTSSTKCPHCKGEVETLGAGRAGKTVRRCRSCGREPDAVASAPAVSGSSSGNIAAPRAGAACTVDGCPGTRDNAGRCDCCEKRQRWAESHAPKRQCAICTGPIAGRTNMKYCKACKPIAQKISQANAPSSKK